MNPNAAATGKPVLKCAANCDAVLFLGCYILIEATEFEITLKVGITLP